jgi:hypothetical protein
VRLIIQGEKKGTTGTKSLVCLVKALDLFLWHPILILAFGILGFVGKDDAPLARQLGVEKAEGFFF